MNNQKIIEEWERKFDEEIGFCTRNDCVNIGEIKKFISTLLSSHRQQLCEEIDKKFSELLQQEANTPLSKRKNGWEILKKARDEVLKIIK